MSRLSAWSRRKLKDPSAVAGTPTGASADTDIVPDTRGVPTAPGSQHRCRTSPFRGR